MSSPEPAAKSPNTQAKQDQSTPARNDGRQFPRYAFRGRAEAVVLPPPDDPGAESEEWEVLATDLSRSGLSVLHRKPLLEGQQLILALSDSQRLVEVRWC